MSRGFHLWHGQPLDRVTPPWLANPRPPATSPHANGTSAPVTQINSGRIKEGRDEGKRMIQRLNEENGRQENTVLSTWRWCKQGWPRLSQTTDHWPRLRSLLLTLLNKCLFNLILNKLFKGLFRFPHVILFPVFFFLFPVFSALVPLYSFSFGEVWKPITLTQGLKIVPSCPGKSCCI